MNWLSKLRRGVPKADTMSQELARAIKGQHAVVSRDVRIGEGTVIWNLVYVGPGVTIGNNVTLGSLVHVAAGASIGDGTMVEGAAYIGRLSKIGRNCFIGPKVVITGDPYPPVRRNTGVSAWTGVTVEDEAIIGAGACIRAGIVVGRRAVVGMGSVVLSDVPPGTVVAGVPARPIYDRDEYDRRQMERAARWEKISP